MVLYYYYRISDTLIGVLETLSRLEIITKLLYKGIASTRVRKTVVVEYKRFKVKLWVVFDHICRYSKTLGSTLQDYLVESHQLTMPLSFLQRRITPRHLLYLLQNVVSKILPNNSFGIISPSLFLQKKQVRREWLHPNSTTQYSPYPLSNFSTIILLISVNKFEWFLSSLLLP